MSGDKIEHLVHLGRDFSETPGGRYKRDGNHSGERLRDDVLIPALERLPPGQVLTVQIDGVMGLPASFAEEAFGGLVRRLGPSVLSRVRVVSDELQDRADRAVEMMNDEMARQEGD